jgi:gamma-glutamyltranspeptidase/glutathione hydrolase
MMKSTLHPVLCAAAVALTLLAGCAPKTDRPVSTGAAFPPSWEFAQERPATVGARGMVASDAPLASETGAGILRRGGNAVDAAVATAFALAVVFPEAGNIGGGGFVVLRMQDGTVAALDFREKAPNAAHADMYLDAEGKPTNGSITGHQASGVPGTVAGLWTVHQRFGRLPWREVVEPAVRLAHDGVAVSAVLTASVRSDSARLARFPASATLFLPDGHPLREGSLWKNPDLARTLQRIADEGPQGFYQGVTAGLIETEMRRGNGLITREDLGQYTAIWRDPITTTYRGHTILSMPPPSSGGVGIALIANMLEPYDLRGLGWHSPDAIHCVVEAMRRAFADRNYFLGDPDVVNIPQKELISKAYAATRGASIRDRQATPSSEVMHGAPQEAHEGVHTTHFSVADSAGNVVALTTTLNFSFGSAVTVSGAGFLLNDEMDDFTSKPGSPNAFGLVQGEANAIAPGKRILSSMSPTIVVDPSGVPLLITGACGGPHIITAVFQIISNVVDYGMDISFAVSAPRFHHQHLPDTTLLEEEGFFPDAIATLHGFGHATRLVQHLAISPSILRKNGAWHGSSDPRLEGAAIGF